MHNDRPTVAIVIVGLALAQADANALEVAMCVVGSGVALEVEHSEGLWEEDDTEVTLDKVLGVTVNEADCDAVATKDGVARSVVGSGEVLAVTQGETDCVLVPQALAVFAPLRVGVRDVVGDAEEQLEGVANCDVARGEPLVVGDSEVRSEPDAHELTREVAL